MEVSGKMEVSGVRCQMSGKRNIEAETSALTPERQRMCLRARQM
jgi:hypothetical protein